MTVPEALRGTGQGTMPLEPDRIAIRFVNEINRHDVDALLAMMAPDFRFIDSLGHEVRGKDRNRAAWTEYFAMFPDYRVVVRDHLVAGSVVALFGTASGTLAVHDALPHANHWTTPGAWRALIREGHVAEWEVYADNDPVRRVMSGVGSETGEPSTPPTAAAADAAPRRD